jgi:hypothetical protein
MQDFAHARECYEATVKLAPRGFFTALTALDTLNREATGELPAGTYFAYLSLEWIDDPAHKAKLVQTLIERVPHFAPAWKEYALSCSEENAKLAALEQGLAARPDPETKGLLIINKALTLHYQSRTQAARELLTNLAQDPATTFANEALAKHTLASLNV